MSVFKKLMMGSSAGGDSYWILKFKPTTVGNQYLVRSVVSADGTDDGNLYWYMSDTSLGHYIVKTDKDGNINAHTKWSHEYWGNLRVDSSENVYLMYNGYISGGYKTSVVKFNSSLTFQDQYYYSNSSAHPGSQNVANRIDGSTLYICAQYSDFYPSARVTGGEVSTSTLTSSNWYSFNGIDGNSPRVLHIDSSSNLYVGGGMRDSGGSDDIGIIKFSGNFNSFSWKRMLDDGNCSDIATDSSGNVYACGKYEYGYPNLQDNFVTKFNSSGTDQWTSSLKQTGSSQYDTFNGGDGTTAMCSIHVNDNGVYTANFSYGNVNSSYNDIAISKWNSSNGNLVESYGITCTSGNLKDPQNRYNTHFLTTETAMYVPMKGPSNGFYLAKLPIEDASGLYGNYTVDGVNFTLGSNGATQGSSIPDSWYSQSTSSTSRTFSNTDSTQGSTSTVTYNEYLTDIA